MANGIPLDVHPPTPGVLKSFDAVGSEDDVEQAVLAAS